MFPKITIKFINTNKAKRARNHLDLGNGICCNKSGIDDEFPLSINNVVTLGEFNSRASDRLLFVGGTEEPFDGAAGKDQPIDSSTLVPN